MKRGTCPKCSSTAIHIDINPAQQPASLVQLKAVLATLVCGACGYLEQYLADTGSRQMVTDSWPAYDPFARERVRRAEAEERQPASSEPPPAPSIVQKPQLAPHQRAERQRQTVYLTTVALVSVVVFFALLIGVLLSLG